MATEQKQEFLTVKELAERWRCDPWVFYNRRNKIEGFPKGIRLTGKKNILFRLSDIIEYENKQAEK